MPQGGINTKYLRNISSLREIFSINISRNFPEGEISDKMRSILDKRSRRLRVISKKLRFLRVLLPQGGSRTREFPQEIPVMREKRSFSSEMRSISFLFSFFWRHLFFLFQRKKTFLPKANPVSIQNGPLSTGKCGENVLGSRENTYKWRVKMKCGKVRKTCLVVHFQY